LIDGGDQGMLTTVAPTEYRLHALASGWSSNTKIGATVAITQIAALTVANTYIEQRRESSSGWELLTQFSIRSVIQRNSPCVLAVHRTG
jgi:hypothetical protein